LASEFPANERSGALGPRERVSRGGPGEAPRDHRQFRGAIIPRMIFDN
jgi:hypothetical protein